MNDLLQRLLGGVYRDEATDGNGAGSGTAAGAPPAGGSGAGTGAGDGKGATGADAGTQAQAGADPDAAKTGAESLVATAKRVAEGGAPATVPEKFVVKDAAGNIDHQASALKMATAYGELEKRVGTAGGAAPTKVEDYKLELQEGETDLPKLDAKMADKFRKSALAAGLNQKQYNAMVRDGNAMISEIFGGATQSARNEARASLIAHYGGVEQFNQAAGRAYEAFAAYATKEELAEIDQIGDFPIFIKVFDRIRAELKEERLPRLNQQVNLAEDAEVAAFYTDPKSAYRDPKHAGHNAAVEKVTAWFNRNPGKMPAHLAQR